MATVNAPRQLNSDGTVNIHCRTCEKFVCRTMYRGFSTVDKCQECLTGQVSPAQYDPLAAMMDPGSLYSEEELAQQPPAMRERFGLVGYVFRALGFGKIKAVIVSASAEVAKRKKRKSLLSEPDEPVEEDKNE